MNKSSPIIKKGRRQNVIITETERNALDDLYHQQGAWTHEEATAACGDRLQFALDNHLIGTMDTLISTLYLILGQGRIAAFNSASPAQSLQNQVTKAYLRLCLKHLGWRVMMEGEPSRKLSKFDPNRSMLHVKTDFGECLLTGHLRSGGYSRQALESLTQRFKITALANDFKIVVLTPSTRRGKNHAEKETSSLKLVTVLPQSTINNKIATRIKKVPPRNWGGFAPDDRPYYTGTAWLEDLSIQGLPDITKEVLSLSRSDRIGEARRALECDAAMSAAQLKRYFGLNVADMKGMPYIETIMRSAKSRVANEINVTFLTSSRQIARRDDTALAYRCGTAEVRYLLGVDSNTDIWQAEKRGRFSYENPDAVYCPRYGERIAVEFDAGSYRPRIISKKLDTFEDHGFEETIWAVTTPMRQRNLNQKIGTKLQRGVMLVNWWE